MARFNSETAKIARAKVKNNPNKWNREQAKKWGAIGLQMRLLNGRNRNQHTKGT